MLLSVVLHIVPSSAMSGDLVGRAESVVSGENQVFHDVAELLDFVRSEARRAGLPEPIG